MSDPKIKMMSVKALKPYENNPRDNSRSIDKVAESIKQFGFKVPIVVDKDGVIVAGHTRYEASLRLGLQKVPVIVADDLSDKQVKAFRLADNKVGESSVWVLDALEEELADLEDMDMGAFGFEESDEDLLEDEPKINIEKSNLFSPTYEIQGMDIDVEDLVDTRYRDELLKEINTTPMPDNIRAFLRNSAQRHLVFDYRAIAEYYAQADEKIQDLMEKSGLVIVDYNKAIEYGYLKLEKDILEDAKDEG